MKLEVILSHDPHVFHFAHIQHSQTGKHQGEEAGAVPQEIAGEAGAVGADQHHLQLLRQQGEAPRGELPAPKILQVLRAGKVRAHGKEAEDQSLFC